MSARAGRYTANLGERLPWRHLAAWAAAGACIAATLMVSPRARITSVEPTKGVGKPSVGRSRIQLLTVRFSMPMNRGSVEQSLRIAPGELDAKWRAMGAYRWHDSRTLVVSPPVEPSPSFFPRSWSRHEVLLRGDARDVLGRRVDAEQRFTFETAPTQIATLECAQQECAAALRRERGLDVTHPSIMEAVTEESHWWTCTVWEADSCHTVYVTPMSNVMVATRVAVRPEGAVRVHVVFVRRGGERGWAARLFARWGEVESGFAVELERTSREVGLQQPLMRVETRTHLLEPDQVPGAPDPDQVRKDLLRLGIHVDPADIVACLDLDPASQRGGWGSGASRSIQLGWYFSADTTATMTEDRALRKVASTLYGHELAHVLGWEHDWSPRFRHSDPWVGRPFQIMADPILLGWTDADGDGTPEIIDSSPYGAAKGASVSHH